MAARFVPEAWVTLARQATPRGRIGPGDKTLYERIGKLTPSRHAWNT